MSFVPITMAATTDMGSHDMTKHNRDLVKRGAAPSTSGERPGHRAGGR